MTLRYWIQTLIPNSSLRVRNTRNEVQFTVAAEVANMIVRETDTSFRDAYRAVGYAVRTAREGHRTLVDFSENEWSAVLHKQIAGSTYRKIVGIAGLRNHFNVYKTRGSPKPDEGRRMIKIRAAKIRDAVRRARVLSTSSDKGIHDLWMLSRTL